MTTTNALDDTYGNDIGLRTCDEVDAFLGEAPSFTEHLWAMVELVELLDQYEGAEL